MQYKGFDLYTNPDRQVARYGEFQDNITEIFNITGIYSSGDYIYIKLTRIPDRIYSIVTIDQNNNENTLNNNEFSLEENGYIKILINNQIKAIRVLYSGTGSLVSAEDIWELQSGILMNENFELRGNAIIDNDLRIKGNLFLEGSTSIIDFSQTNELKVKDKLIYLNFENQFFSDNDYGLKIVNNTNDKFGLIFNNDEFSINKYDSGQIIKYASFLSNGINLNINNDTVLKITNDKKVGILNSSPSGTLSISTYSGNIHFGGQYPDLWFDGGSDSVFFISNRGASNGRTSITYNNTELFSVLNNGNVGIGNTNPTEKLSVAGNIILDTNQDAYIGTKNNYALKLRTNNTDRIIITNNGNVGIGTSTITDKLTVNGSISSTSLKTNLIDVSNGSGTFNNLTVNANTNLNGTSTLTGIINLNGDIYKNGQQLHWENLVFYVETRTGDGITKDFTLNEIPLQDSLIVSRNGILLTAGIDYDVSGNIVSFIEPPVNGSQLRFQYVKYIPSTTNVSQLLLSYNNSWTGENYFLNKVGIGTTNPIQQLHVNGNIYISDNVGIGTTMPITQLHVSGKIPISEVGSVNTNINPFSAYVKDCYVYVVNYSSNTLQIFNVSIPSSPTLVSSVNTGSNPRSIYIQGHYAYITNENNNVLQIFDISNPYSPTLVGSVSTWNNPRSVYVQGRYAYVLSYGTFNLQIFDVSNPSSPTLISSINTTAYPYSIYVQGRYAYVVGGWSSSLLQIFDVSNPSSPTLISSVSVVPSPYSIYVQGSYVYLVNNSSSSFLQIFNISNPSSPTLVSSINIGSFSSSIYVQGCYAYVTSNNVLQIFDISNPYSPTLIGSVNVASGPSLVYVQGRYAYVLSWYNNILQIFDIGGAYIQQLEAGGIKTGTLQINNNLIVNNDTDIQGGLAVSRSIVTYGGFSSYGNGYFSGNVGIGTTNPTSKLHVIGSFTATGTKNFEIDHPTKPGMKLIHASIEGPEAAVYYRGEGKLTNGETIIELPEYFEKLTRKEGRTIQLTAIGTKPYFLSASRIKDGKFVVYGTKPDGEFCWEVKAIRADVEPLQVEKVNNENDKYILDS